MRHLFVCLMLLSLTLKTANAQVDSSWPPHPDTIFAPEIEVLRVDPLVDHEGRVLYLYDEADGWHAYPYPSDFNFIEGLGVRPDGTWLIFERSDQQPSQYSSWVLDPITGTYTQIAAPCGLDRDGEENSSSVIGQALNVNTVSLDKTWVYTGDGDTVRLCSLLTEQKSQPLPEHISDSRAYYGIPLLPDISPDGRYAVFMTYKDNPNSVADYTIYSYDLLTDNLLNPGMIYPGFGEEIGLSGWLDNKQFVIGVSMMPEWSMRNIYVGDASQANSVDFAASKLRFSPEIIGEQLSVEAMDAVMMDGPSGGPCFLDRYDALTGQYASYDTGDLCEYGVPIPDDSGHRLYRALVPSMTLVRFNPETGQRISLFTGEIETIESVSPGGSYAVIGLGKNGTVEIGQDPDGNANIDYYYDTEKYLTAVVGTHVIVDLESGNLIGTFPDTAQWFSDNTFLIMPQDEPSQLVTIDDSKLSRTDLPGSVQFLLTARGQVLLQRDNDSADLYTLTTGVAIPTLKNMSGLTYALYQKPDDTIQVQVWRSAEPNSARATYTIRLP